MDNEKEVKKTRPIDIEILKLDYLAGRIVRELFEALTKKEAAEIVSKFLDQLSESKKENKT